MPDVVFPQHTSAPSVARIAHALLVPALIFEKAPEGALSMPTRSCPQHTMARSLARIAQECVYAALTAEYVPAGAAR